MPARFFVDENDLALGKALAAQHDGVVFPGHPDLPHIPRGSADDVWLPVIGATGLVVLTRDKQIRYRPAERLAWVEHRVRGFVLTGRKSQSTGASESILNRHWSMIEALVEKAGPGPWMYALTDGGVRVIDLT